MLDHPWLTMPANYKTKLTNEEFQAERSKESTEGQSDYYANVEMSKLTDSEGEYQPADDEDYGATNKQQKQDRLEAFFKSLDDSGHSLDLSDEEPRPRQKMFRDLAEGQNLNNSFGFYSPEDWDHLHVDKGMNPQFNVLK